MELGTRLRFIRKRNSLKLKDLALGICSVSYLSKIENNTVIPSNEIIEHLCNRLGVRSEDLISDEKAMSELKAELIHLNYIISKKEINNATHAFESIKDKYYQYDIPEMNYLIILFDFRISLLMNNKERADELYEILLSLADFKPEGFDYFYYRFCGLHQYLHGSYQKSLSCYKEAEKHMLESEQEEVYYQLSLVYSCLRKISLSTFYLIKALNIYNKKMNFEMSTNCNLLLGVNYRKIGEYEQSIECFNKIINYCPDSQKESILSKVYHNLGLVYSTMSDSEKAISSYSESLKFKPKLATTRINALYLLAKEYIKVEHFEAAKKLVRKAKDLALNHHTEGLLIKLNVIEFHVNQELDKTDYENYLIITAIPYFKKRNEISTVNYLLRLLAEYYEGKKKYKQAYSFLKELII